MPSGPSRNPLKNFRRKSSANVLEQQQQSKDSDATTPSSSFRVLDRSDKANAGFQPNRNSTYLGGSTSLPFSRSVDNLAHYLYRPGPDPAARNRGSGATTNSLSSAFYETTGSSPRHSSSSTLPSSLDADGEQDRSPIEKKNRHPPTAPSSAIDPPPSFVARAGRAFSFGRKKSPGPSLQNPDPVPSIPQQFHTPIPQVRPKSENSLRDRSFTTSSYASTAKPPRLDTNLGGASLRSADDGFENIFDGLGLRESVSNHAAASPPAVMRVAAPVPDLSHTAAQPARSPSRPPALASPTLLPRPDLDHRRQSWNSQKSHDHFISAPSPELGSPNAELFPAAPKAAILSTFGLNRGYSAVPDRYQSPDLTDSRESPTFNSGFGNAQLHRESYQSNDGSRGVSSFASQERFSWAEQKPSAASPGVDHRLSSSSGGERGVTSMMGAAASRKQLPQNKSQIEMADENPLWVVSPPIPAEESVKVGKQRADLPPAVSTTPKKMTRAEFDMASKLRNAATNDTEKSDESSTEDSEDEDESGKQKKLAAERRRQEATMSVYRQKMKKVTGGSGNLSSLPSQAPRSPLQKSPSSNSLLGVDPRGPSPSRSTSPSDLVGGTEDDNVPLGILQAHGFPTKVRPPSQMPGAQPGYVENPNALPAFARNLPVDPYYGASLVNNPQRESLGLGGSVYGGSSPLQPPYPQHGGLVGVIASEERSRASRRGSPNPLTGGYGPIPLPSNMYNSLTAPFGRSSTMMNLNHPQTVGTPYGAPTADMSVMNAQQQMAQFMQMQTQMMQQMMAMQAGQSPGMAMSQMQYPFPSMGTNLASNLLGIYNSYPQVPLPADRRPASQMSFGRPSSATQARSSSMLQLPTDWTGGQAAQRSRTMDNLTMSQYGPVSGLNLGGGPAPGYTPSIAPSERSNVGMPNRYRPVSIMEPENAMPRSKTMTSLSTAQMKGAFPLSQTSGNATKPNSTIRLIDRLKSGSKMRAERSDDDEDEAGWAQLARKKEAMAQKRAAKSGPSDEPALASLYQELEQHITAM